MRDAIEQLADRPGVRVTFDQGRLQAVSPLRAQEHYAQVMADMALIVAETLDLPFEQLGSTTLRQLERQRGVEPDRCFYIANAGRIAGKTTLDLIADPPPDIVVRNRHVERLAGEVADLRGLGGARNLAL